MDEQAALDRIFGILARNGMSAEEVQPGLLRIDRPFCWIYLQVMPARADLEMPTVGALRTYVLRRTDHEGPVRRAVINELLRELNDGALFLRYEVDDDGDFVARNELAVDDLQASELRWAIRRLELSHFFDESIVDRSGGMTHETWLETDD